MRIGRPILTGPYAFNAADAYAVLFAVAWMNQDKGVYLALAVVFAIFGSRSSAATRKK